VLQYGVVPEQSAFVAHATHWLWLHAGVDVPAQSALLEHPTHCAVVGSQILRELGQSAPELQPTHAPVLTLQIDALLPFWHCWLLMHAAWHVWFAGQHAGAVPAPQSAFDLH
jgi:hypothetical protein